MKKSLIALSVSNILIASSSFAASSTLVTSAKAPDETIIVTANRSTQQQFDVLAATDIFDRTAIEQLQPLSMSDLLNKVAGITTASTGSHAHQTSLFVRGSNSGHVLILVNGVRVGSATLGNKDISAIDMQLVERVEVVRGPRAALWGSDAVGGVIQIFTRQFTPEAGQVGVKLGSDSLWQTYGAIGLGNEQHTYTLSASIEAAEGFDVLTPTTNSSSVDQPDKDGYSRESFALNGTSHFNSIFSLEVNAQYEQGKTKSDASPFYTGDETEYKNHHLLARSHFQLENSYFQLGFSTEKDRNEDNFDQVSLLMNVVNDAITYETHRDQINALAQFKLAQQSEISVGADWYNEEVSSTTEYSSKEREANAFYVIGRHDVELSESSLVKLEAAVRRDEVGDIDAEVTYQLGAGYQIKPKLLISLTHGSAFKAPTFNTLYWPGDTYYIGNENLQPETSKNTEFLTRFQDDNYQIEVSLYQTKFDNLIEDGPADINNPWGLWTPSNIAKATVKGVEATLNADIANTTNVLTLSHIDAQDDSTKTQLLRRPYFSANYSVTYHGVNEQGNDWNIALEVNHQGSRYDNFNFQRTRMPSYTLMNISARYQVNAQLSLLGKITNVGDRDYQQIPEYYGAERGYYLTLDYRF